MCGAWQVQATLNQVYPSPVLSQNRSQRPQPQTPVQGGLRVGISVCQGNLLEARLVPGEEQRRGPGQPRNSGALAQAGACGPQSSYGTLAG